MAEALGLAANIFAVVDMAGKVAVLSYNYIGSAKRARKDLKELVDELHPSVQVPVTLQVYVEANGTQSTALGKLNYLSGPLKACAQELQELQLKLQPPRTGLWGVMDRLKWPLKEGETRGQIERLERHKALFTLAVSTDQM